MFILCTGKLAKTPYVIPYTDNSIYSLEELCYYIYNNIYNITEEFIKPALIKWLEDEAGHEVLADKLREMTKETMPNLKDMVVTTLCSCDYYNEEEIRQLVQIMDNIANLPLHARSKIKADNYLKYGQYGKAAAAYRRLLNGSLAMNFSTEEYGNILHNQGIAHFYVSSFSEAARDFKEAYARNGNRESIRHYLYIMLMEDEQKFEEEALNAGFSNDDILEMHRKYVNSANAQENERSFPADYVDQCKDQIRKAFAL